MDNKYEKAKELRKSSTPQEQKLWKLLRNRGFENYKFRRQYPLGKYILDFVCREKRLVIEIDGGQHNTPEAIEYDNQRTEYLKTKGYEVIRFWNNDIDNNLEGVYQVLKERLR